MEKTLPVTWLDGKLLLLYCHTARISNLRPPEEYDYNHGQIFPHSTHEAT